MYMRAEHNQNKGSLTKINHKNRMEWNTDYLGTNQAPL